MVVSAFAAVHGMHCERSTRAAEAARVTALPSPEKRTKDAA
ncbi:hypothetical protein ACWDE9_28695 [Streptomyces olivaceoviridis]